MRPRRAVVTTLILVSRNVLHQWPLPFSGLTTGAHPCEAHRTQAHPRLVFGSSRCAFCLTNLISTIEMSNRSLFSTSSLPSASAGARASSFLPILWYTSTNANSSVRRSKCHVGVPNAACSQRKGERDGATRAQVQYATQSKAFAFLDSVSSFSTKMTASRGNLFSLRLFLESKTRRCHMFLVPSGFVTILLFSILALYSVSSVPSGQPT